MGLYEKTQCHLMGDRGLLLEFGDEISRTINEKVRRMAVAIDGKPLPGILETVPTYRSLLIIYDPRILPLAQLKEYLSSLEGRFQVAPPDQPRLRRIPVHYGGEFGPDLNPVAEYHHITPEAVIRLHCSQPYLVYLIGFMPGFPYMGELPEGLITPRLKTPRLSVPTGSVAIAQKQTGIYPMESPGGWQILGRTPVKLFDPGKDPPAYLQMGDWVQFFPIGEQEYRDWREG